MSGCLGPSISFPRRFVTRPETCSPFLCRPSQHGLAGCASHGQPAASTGPGRNARAASRDKAPAPNAEVEALRRELADNDNFIASLLARLRDFPDAAAAISEMIKRSAAHPKNHQPDGTYD